MEIIVGLIVIALFVALVLFAAPLMLWWAWNAVVPALFHGPHINFWQAFALTILISVVGNFFKGSK